MKRTWGIIYAARFPLFHNYNCVINLPRKSLTLPEICFNIKYLRNNDCVSGAILFRIRFMLPSILSQKENHLVFSYWVRRKVYWERKKRKDQNLFIAFAISFLLFLAFPRQSSRAEGHCDCVFFSCSSHFRVVILSICFGISIIQPNNFESNKLRIILLNIFGSKEYEGDVNACQRAHIKRHWLAE